MKLPNWLKLTSNKSKSLSTRIIKVVSEDDQTVYIPQVQRKGALFTNWMSLASVESTHIIDETGASVPRLQSQMILSICTHVDDNYNKRYHLKTINAAQMLIDLYYNTNFIIKDVSVVGEESIEESIEASQKILV